MDIVVITLLAVGTVIVLIVGAFVLRLPSVRGGDASNNLRAIVSAQRNTTTGKTGGLAVLAENAARTDQIKIRSSQLDLVKMLKYAQWKITPVMFRLCEAGAAVVGFLIFGIVFDFWFQIVGAFLGVIVAQGVLLHAVDARFREFEKDYAPFLMSFVALLKTGMNPITGLQSAGEGLEPGSLVKAEVELMLERLKLGVSEEQSIGAFGEDIYHPEIELFVQALILGKRVGGNLSSTLERLAQQVRKRTIFREQARAAVALQRASIGAIVAILLLLEGYVYMIAPELVTGGLHDPLGWQLVQFGFFLIVLGMYFIRIVTKIKI